MPRPRKRYPPEFRRQLIELARGREEPGGAREGVRAVGPDHPDLSQASRARCRPAARWLDHPGARGDHPAPAGAAAGQTRARDFVKSDGLVRQGDRHDPPTRLPVRERSLGRVPGHDDVSCPPGLPQRLLRLAYSGSVGPGAAGCGSARQAPLLSPALGRDIRRPAFVEGPAGIGGDQGRPEAGGPADACRGARGREPAARRPYDQAGSG
jgi:hypothetical protein